MKNKRQLSRNHGWLFRLTWPMTHYIAINFFAALGFLFFKIFHKTKIIGKENVPKCPNTLLLSNHQSMIDSFLVGLHAYFPTSLIRPSVIPWNLAAEENFYRNFFVGWLADNWKCIPVKKGRKDVSAIFKMADALQTSPMVVFPEGTRSRDGSIGPPRGGAGMLILESKPTVIPVCIDGMDELLPIGSVFPRLFKRIYVYYGKPLDLSKFYGMVRTKETANAIMEHVMETMRKMKAEIEALKDENGAYSDTKLLPQKKFKSQKAI